MKSSERVSRCAKTYWLISTLLLFCVPVSGQTHTIEVLADHDSRFKIDGRSSPQITLKAGEPVLFRITAVKGMSQTRDGFIHGFTLVRLKDRVKVRGWNLQLQPGLREFTLTAPSEPGEYEILCTVICSEEHEGMRMKVLVLP